ncbi:MAG TPA: AAA family ATPase, partial [Candidatus Dormibacteraeota bacterium]|nr:AAA family ATPase [Candidatus Dormibacteraeota bacterium]
MLDELLVDIRHGVSRSLVLWGEAGIGKTALLRYLVDSAADMSVVWAAGVESEMELAFASLHQVCGPLLGRLERLPVPQRQALETVFGVSAGAPPDRFLVGLAVLSLIAETAEARPLLCVVDDAQWLDQASALTLAFVARRLLAEPVGMVFAAREPGEELQHVSELEVRGLVNGDARALLLGNVRGRLDAAVCEQLIAESHGNPLALIELPRTWGAADLAGGFGVPASRGVDSKIEQSYVRRIARLPSDTQMLVLAAAAEPLGDPVLLERAVGTLGVGMAAAGPAVEAALFTVGRRVEFAHPLVRSAAYRAAAPGDRRRVHRALAESTDPQTDPDRRAWHRARATPGTDEEVAADLERSASRAQARGGVAAAAAFLERAAALSPDLGDRARRALEAADAKQLAGAPQAASALLAAAVEGPLDERKSALAERLRGQIALDLRRFGEAVPFLVEAAGRLELSEPMLARTTYLEALRAAHIGAPFGAELLRRAADAARNAAPASGASGAFDLLLAGLAVRFTEGYTASAVLLKRALRTLHDEDGRAEQDVRWPGVARAVALDLFDDQTCHAICTRSVELARERGALGVLPLALNYLAVVRSFEGDLDAAQALVDESDAIADASGATRIEFAKLPLAGFHGDEAALSKLVEATEPIAIARAEGVLLTFGEHARALLYNGLGNYEAALPLAERASARDQLTVSIWSVPEVVEAAVRCGRSEAAAAALDRLTERTQAAGTELALGIEARSRALLSEGRVADELYREAVDRLGRCRLAPDRARAHLLYGEWLRRERRRIDAREQLRAGHDRFTSMGMEAFAERARHELLATGERVHKRTVEAQDDLTPQERQIARLARDGLSNVEIGARLFISQHTVAYHLRKVFSKLGVTKRHQLADALGDQLEA